MKIVREIKLNLPFHVKSSLSKMHELKKVVDLIILVSDARSQSSTNFLDELLHLFPKIKILSLISKRDLSSKNLPNSFNFKLKRSRGEILKLIRNALRDDFDLCKQEGYFRIFQILVVGVPNVGKSTLINLLRNKKVAIAQNKPGLTRKITKYFVDDNICVYDSPGILITKKLDFESAEKLFFINAIPYSIKDHSFLLEKAYEYLNLHNSDFLHDLVYEKSNDYVHFLNLLSQRYNFKIKGGTLDLDRAELKFLDLIRSSKVFWDEV